MAIRAMAFSMGLSFFTLASIPHASAQISLTTAVDLAIRNDPRVKTAQADVDKAKASLAQAHDAYVPSVSANGGIGDSVGVPQSLPIIFSVSSQSLVFNGSQRGYLKAANAGVIAANLALQEAQDQTAEDAVLTYIHLDNALRRRSAISQEYQYASRLVAIVQDRVEAGQDARVELFRAKRSADATKLAQFQVEDEIAVQADHLARLMGLPGNPVFTVPESIPGLPKLDLAANDTATSYGVESAFANAESKADKAGGDKHFWGIPQIGLGASYSRISTIGTNYGVYYPAFSAANISADRLSLNSLSLGVEVKVPIFDRGHQAIARESAADARHALFEAETQRNQFLDGRFKLSHSAAELSAARDLADDDQQLAQAQLDAVLLQLTANNVDPNRPQMTPKDEQSARVQERERTVDLLNRQLDLQQAEVNLLRQTGRLDSWLKSAAAAPETISTIPIHP
jgi:outer membrane protein TolC